MCIGNTAPAAGMTQHPAGCASHRLPVISGAVAHSTDGASRGVVCVFATTAAAALTSARADRDNHWQNSAFHLGRAAQASTTHSSKKALEQHLRAPVHTTTHPPAAAPPTTPTTPTPPRPTSIILIRPHTPHIHPQKPCQAASRSIDRLKWPLRSQALDWGILKGSV